jgi:hypothetical protein
MPTLFALSSSLPLVKTLEQTPQGIQKTPYPNVRDFTSHRLAASNIVEFGAAAQLAASRGWCLVKGALNKDLVNESRAGSTDAFAATDWICLDFDGVTAASIDALLEPLGLADVSYVVQWSASAGLKPGIISAHVFMLLDSPVPAAMLKTWLVHKNLTSYRDQIGLNRIGTALRWPLDITTCQNDKLLYIAPPVFVGMLDPVPNRFEVHQRNLGAIPAMRIAAPHGEVERQKNELLHELRKAAGYTKLRESQQKMLGGQIYLAKPGQFTISAVKEARGYRYFNFNGGDSWAYYQPIDDPRFVHNFKGEPAYLLQEIAPEYYAELMGRKRAETAAHTEHFAFLDPHSDTIYTATWDTEAGCVAAYSCRSERNAQIFLTNHGVPVPETLPSMRLVFDPHGEYVVDNDTGLVNVYRSPGFTVRNDVREVPTTIAKVIRHAVGENAIYHAFLKWVRAVVVQRDHTAIAWVLQGTQGTGKGVLFHRILAPLVGRDNAALVPMMSLADRFNGFIHRKLLVAVDEAQFSALGSKAPQLESNIKSWITEPKTVCREMYSRPHEVENHSNFLFYSNKPDPVTLPPDDRRFQIGRYQATPIELNEADLERIDTELEAFYSWLAAQPAVSMDEVRQIVQSADRAQLIDLSQTTIDGVAERLIAGDIAFFFTQIDTLGGSTIDTAEIIPYKLALLHISLRAANNPDQGYVTREELMALLNYLAGNVRKAPHHFTSLLKHHRIYLKDTAPDGRRGYCMHVTWNCKDPDWYREMIEKYLKDVLPTAKTLEKVPAASNA